MNKSLFVTAVLIVIFSFQSHARVIEGIAAAVNDDVITYSELSERVEPFGAGEDSLQEIRRRELDSLIEERLIAQKASEMGISASREEVEKEINDIRASFPSDEAFRQFLRERNLTEPVLRDRLRARLLLGKAAEAEIMPGIDPPSREEAKNFYDGNPGMFVEPVRHRLSRILIAAGEERCLEDAETEIREIRQKIAGGGDFSALARKHSDGPEASEGGGLGFVSTAEVLPEIESAVSGLSPGEITAAVRTEEGLSIFKVSDISGGRQADFAEVEEAVRRHLFQLRMEEEVDAWLQKLRSEAHIMVNMS